MWRDHHLGLFAQDTEDAVWATCEHDCAWRTTFFAGIDRGRQGVLCGYNDEGGLGWKILEEKKHGSVHSSTEVFYPSQYGPNGMLGNMLNGDGSIFPLEQRKEAHIMQITEGET